MAASIGLNMMDMTFLQLFQNLGRKIAYLLLFSIGFYTILLINRRVFKNGVGNAEVNISSSWSCGKDSCHSFMSFASSIYRSSRS